MQGLMTSSLAALALLAAPALAQEATTGDAAAGGDPQIRDTAIASAQGVGIADAQPLDGAFVLQGTSPTGTPIMMIVGPAGELLALATPITLGTPGGAEGGAAAGEVTDVAPTSAETGGEPAAGEPADEGFMATQVQPATPNMWDPAQVEGAMLGLGGGGGTTTGAGGVETTSP